MLPRSVRLILLLFVILLVTWAWAGVLSALAQPVDWDRLTYLYHEDSPDEPQVTRYVFVMGDAPGMRQDSTIVYTGVSGAVSAWETTLDGGSFNAGTGTFELSPSLRPYLDAFGVDVNPVEGFAVLLVTRQRFP